MAGEHSAGPVARVGHLAIGSVDILSVEVETDSGPIAIYARDDGAVTIDAIGHDPATAQIDMRLRGDALQFTTRSIVRSRKPWRALKPPATGLRVGLPSGLTIRATTGAGSVDVRGLTGDIVIETASGAVDIDGPCRSLTIVTNSGAARLSHLAGSLSFRSATGQLDASWIRLPETGTIDIKTGRGDISLRLPPLARVQAQFITGPAAITNEFASASEAGIKLSVTSRASHISVTKAEGADIDSPVSDN
ncbi:MAG: DUF4097 family beta strand repeat-containing protein [Pseudomonadales bacterium]